MIWAFKRAGAWLYDRLGLERIVDFVIRHPVPYGNTKRIGWLYTLGIATFTAFLLQVLTGTALATKYIPSPAHAYSSLLYITEEAWFGWLLRGMHYFGASAMVVLISAHMARVFLTGSYKFPREMNWVFGVLLLVLTVAMALTGQLLRWDEHGIWTVTVAAHFVGRVPLIGEFLARFVLAGDTVGGATLSRFFVFHVMILPVLIFLTVGIHLYLVLHHGVSEPPKAGRPVDPETYREWYKEHAEKSGRQYVPDAAWREAVAALVVVLTVIALAYLFGPRGPDAPPDPVAIAADPRPDWYLRWYYALLWVKPRGLETFIMVYLPLLVLGGLLLLPFVFNKGERSPRRRPLAVLTFGVIAAVLIALTELGMRAPWAMEFETVPLQRAQLPVPEGEAWQGAQLFYARGCQYCHMVLGEGGTFGPDLTDATRRLPPEVIVERTLNGIGDMPAYRDVLNREELDAILAFLRSLEGR